MADIEEVTNRIMVWIEQAIRLIDKIAAVEDKRSNVPRAEKTELEQRYKKLIMDGESHSQKVKPLVDQCYSDLLIYQDRTTGFGAAAEILRIGSILLENTPTFQSPVEFLHGMYAYFSYIYRTILGAWNAPVHSIMSLDLNKRTRELLFFYNGIATVGHLQYLIRKSSTLTGFTPAGILECQNELKARGYAIFPDADNRSYWEQLTEQSQGLWKCVVNGKISIYIELDLRQALALSNYPCVTRLPGGLPVAKLEAMNCSGKTISL